MDIVTSFVFYSDGYSVTVTPDNHFEAAHIQVVYNAVYSVYAINNNYPDKVALIKMVRKCTKLGLKDAKYLVDDAQNAAKRY